MFFTLALGKSHNTPTALTAVSRFPARVLDKVDKARSTAGVEGIVDPEYDFVTAAECAFDNTNQTATQQDALVATLCATADESWVRNLAGKIFAVC